jgi:hypothetical protein
MLSFWTEEKSLSVFLALLVLQIFVIAPLSITNQFHLYMLNGLVGSLFLLSGLLTLTHDRLSRWIASGFIVAAMVSRWLVLSTPSHWIQVVDSTITLCFAAGLTTVVLHNVYKEGPISGHRVRGSVAAYLLLGYLFAAAYRLTYDFIPEAFTINTSLLDQGQNVSGIFMYFSLVTLTTVGFGDVTAVHPVARSLVTLEGVVGTLYPAILIARLVSLHSEHAKK